MIKQHPIFVIFENNVGINPNCLCFFTKNCSSSWYALSINNKKNQAVDLRDRRIKNLSKTSCSKIVTWTTNEETLQESFEKGSATIISRKGERRVFIGSCVCPYKVALMQLRKIFMFNKSLK